MRINVYGYEKLVETYPADKYNIILKEYSRDSLYIVDAAIKDPFSDKINIYVNPVDIKE